MECFVIFVMAWCWCNATESKPQNVVGKLKIKVLNKNEMKNLKTILTLLICISSIGFSLGQIKLNGTVYSDTTLSQTIPKVKIILTSNGKSLIYKTDKNGYFEISPKEISKMYSITIKKKGYITLKIDDVTENFNFDVILKKSLSLHDEDYEGTSEIVARK